MLKKLLALTVSAALIIPAFALTSLASNGDVIDVGDSSEKLLTDFENYDDGLRISQCTNKEFVCSNDNDAAGGVYQIKADKGQNASKGLYEAASSQLVNGLYSCFEYIPLRDAPTKTVDYQGGTDLVFWIDNTIQTNTAKVSSFQIVWEEWDYNSDGSAATVTNDQDQIVPKVTSWALKDSKTNPYYLMADDETAWTQEQGTAGTYISISNTFKGYVRIPLSSFNCCWSSTDNDGKADLKHIVDIQMYYGIYPRDINGAFVLDNIGFLGDFQATTTAEPTTVETTAESTTVAPTTESTTIAPTEESTTVAPTEESTTEPTSVTTAEPTTESSTDASSTTSASAVITTAPVATTASTAAPATTTASLDNTDTTTTPETTATQSPKTGEMPIAAALLTAVALAGVLVVTKKSK